MCNYCYLQATVLHALSFFPLASFILISSTGAVTFSLRVFCRHRGNPMSAPLLKLDAVNFYLHTAGYIPRLGVVRFSKNLQAVSKS